ncbi:MAG: holo-ACP synthase [Phycisphaerales bacterium]|nr:holo-ACP synthase [Phycisphaerales bacterium]
MGIVGHGIDLAEVARIAQMRAEHEEHFLNRCFTAAEQAYCLSYRDADIHFAGRFAAKEAVLKVLGTGLRGQISWMDMEIVNDAAGKPGVTLTGECARIAAELGIEKWHLSITHTGGVAMASAIGESTT